MTVPELRARGLSYSEIAARLGMTRGKVAGVLYRERKGMTPRPAPLDPAIVRAELDRNGNNQSAAARALRVSRWSIQKASDRPGRRISRRSPIRATDPATVATLEAIERSGMMDIEIADRAGISTQAIRKWRAGKSAGRPQFLEWVREAIDRFKR